MSSRPAPAARPRSTDPDAPSRVRGLTARGAALLAVGLVAAASLLGPVRTYVAQQSQLSALREDIGAREQRVADLQAQAARWDDPAYAAAQARARFGYVLPGETGYTVLGAPTPAPSGAGATTPTATAAPSPTSLLERVRSGLGLDGATTPTPEVTPAEIAPAATPADPAAGPAATPAATPAAP